MTYQVEVKHLESSPLAVVRRRARVDELVRVVPEACGEVWDFVRDAQVERPGRLVAVYLDSEMNIEIGVELPASCAGAGNVFSSATPAGLVATTAHMGPYNRLGDAYSAIEDWCREHQHTVAWPRWEIYGHWNDDPEQLRTDVFIAVGSGQ